MPVRQEARRLVARVLCSRTAAVRHQKLQKASYVVHRREDTTIGIWALAGGTVVREDLLRLRHLVVTILPRKVEVCEPRPLPVVAQEESRIDHAERAEQRPVETSVDTEYVKRVLGSAASGSWARRKSCSSSVNAARTPDESNFSVRAALPTPGVPLSGRSG
eukprot:7389452-Prymnesium_polylepis.1